MRFYWLSFLFLGVAFGCSPKTSISLLPGAGKTPPGVPDQAPVSVPAPQTEDLPKASSRKIKVAIPAYYYPGPLWEKSLLPDSKNEVLIMNPNSGPGNQVDLNYVNSVKSAQAHGAMILGYVHTSYGARNIGDVEAEALRYQSMYQVDGIFFDEAAAEVSKVGYYEELYRFMRESASNQLIVLNPGVYPPEQYMNLADIILVFEGSSDSYLNLVVPDWTSKYSADQFYHVVYSASGEDSVKKVFSLAEKNHVGYLFVTDEGMPNPYGTLPSYWAFLAEYF